jgi:hypothetical protein
MEETNRQSRYNKFSELRSNPIISECLFRTIDFFFEQEVEIKTKDKETEDEISFFIGQIENKLPKVFGSLFTFGDAFLEVVSDPDNKRDGILFVQVLDANTMYRIEDIKGKLLEFQQSKNGIDYIALTQNKTSEYAIRFNPSLIVHFKVDDFQTYPYGLSILGVDNDHSIDENVDREVILKNPKFVLWRKAISKGLTTLCKRHLKIKGKDPNKLRKVYI